MGPSLPGGRHRRPERPELGAASTSPRAARRGDRGDRGGPPAAQAGAPSPGLRAWPASLEHLRGAATPRPGSAGPPRPPLGQTDPPLRVGPAGRARPRRRQEARSDPTRRWVAVTRARSTEQGGPRTQARLRLPARSRSTITVVSPSSRFIPTSERTPSWGSWLEPADRSRSGECVSSG